MIVGFLKWLYCMCCVLLRALFPAQSTFPTALVVCHCCSGKALGQLLPLPRGLQTEPCPSAQPNRRDVPSPEKLALTSGLPFSCCFLCHKPILQELLRGECWSLFAASEEAACKRKAAFVACVVPLVSNLNLVLWAEVSIYEPDVTWKVMTAAVGYSWMIRALLPSAASWQAQRNADLSQSEIKCGT